MYRRTLEKHLASSGSSNQEQEFDSKVAMHTVIPSGSIAAVERAIFDTICGFTSGLREGDDKGRPRGRPKSLGGRFKLGTSKDGLMDIIFEEEFPNSPHADALELLSTLQIPVFLKFVQHKNEERSSHLFCEKIVSLLNYIRNITTEMSEQVAEVRIEIAKRLSQDYNATGRLDRLKNRLLREKLARQKICLKLVCEQLRQSDAIVALEALQREVQVIIYFLLIYI